MFRILLPPPVSLLRGASPSMGVGVNSQHKLDPNQLPDLIGSVHRAISQLGKPVQLAEVRNPAVPVRRSIE